VTRGSALRMVVEGGRGATEGVFSKRLEHAHNHCNYTTSLIRRATCSVRKTGDVSDRECHAIEQATTFMKVICDRGAHF